MVLDSLDVDIVRHEGNRGYGFALVSLFNYFQGIDADIAVIIDADVQHDPRYISLLIEHIKGGGCAQSFSSSRIGLMSVS